MEMQFLCDDLDDHWWYFFTFENGVQIWKCRNCTQAVRRYDMNFLNKTGRFMESKNLIPVMETEAFKKLKTEAGRVVFSKGFWIDVEANDYSTYWILVKVETTGISEIWYRAIKVVLGKKEGEFFWRYEVKCEGLEISVMSKLMMVMEGVEQFDEMKGEAVSSEKKKDGGVGFMTFGLKD